MTCVHLHCIYQTMDPMNMTNTTHNHCTSSLYLHMTSSRPHLHRTLLYTYQTHPVVAHRHNTPPTHPLHTMYILPVATCGTHTIHPTHASHTIYPHTDIPRPVVYQLFHSPHTEIVQHIDTPTNDLCTFTLHISDYGPYEHAQYHPPPLYIVSISTHDP